MAVARYARCPVPELRAIERVRPPALVLTGGLEARASGQFTPLREGCRGVAPDKNSMGVALSPTKDGWPRDLRIEEAYVAGFRSGDPQSEEAKRWAVESCWLGAAFVWGASSRRRVNEIKRDVVKGFGYGHWPGEFGDRVDAMLADWRREVDLPRTILSALRYLREPSEEMKDAGGKAIRDYPRKGDRGGVAEACWSAMIDKIRVVAFQTIKKER